MMSAKPKAATMSINPGAGPTSYKVGQVLDLHGINATVKGIEELDLVIEYPNGAVREMGKTYLDDYAKYASLPDGAKLTRPVEGGEGREFLWVTDCLPTSYDVSVMDRHNQLSDQNMTPYKAVIEWHMDGLAVDPTSAPASSSYKPELLKAQPADHVTDSDDMVSREEFDAAVATAVNTSKENHDLRQQNMQLMMDVTNHQATIEDLRDELAAMERKVKALADPGGYEYDWNGSELPAGIGKRAELGWVVYQLTFSADNTKMGVVYRKLKDANPLPVQPSKGAATHVTNGAAQYIMQGDNARIVATGSKTPASMDEIAGRVGAAYRDGVANYWRQNPKRDVTRPLFGST